MLYNKGIIFYYIKQVKLAILDHLHEMTMMAEPHEFVASESCRQVALCVIQWTNEPKSLEIRKVLSHDIIVIFLVVEG